MKTATFFGTLFLLIVFSTMQAHARAVRVLDIKTLMKDSQLVFVGKVKSVKPSGITTELTYPTWEDVVFEWLRVEVEVIEPVKGTKKGEIVSTLMLSHRGLGPMFNPPGMVEPTVGQYHLLCLLPANATGVHAAVTAPFDDDQAIFLLDRKHWTDRTHYWNKEGKEVAFHEQSDKNRALWDLVNDKGEINRDGAEHLRKKYAAEIAIPPANDAVIHLKWKKQTSAGGWQSNVPDNGRDADGKTKGKVTDGPVTSPNNAIQPTRKSRSELARRLRAR
jgi:hypothetical protein